MITWDTQLGRLVASADEQRAVQELLREAGELLGTARADEILRSFGSAIREPIKRAVDYVEVFGDVFVSSSIGYNESREYPIEEYDVVVRQVAPDGSFNPNRLGFSWGSMDLVAIDSAFEIHDIDLRRATWDIVGRAVGRTSMEMARKRDTFVQAALDTAASSLTGHVVTVTGGALTKAAVDTVFDEAARLGIAISKVVINSADVNKMRGWTTDIFGPSPANQELLRQGFLGNYGGAEWRRSLSIKPYAVGSQIGYVYFLGAADEIGYRMVLEEMMTETERSARRSLTSYFYKQMMGWAVANAYPVFQIKIED